MVRFEVELDFVDYLVTSSRGAKNFYDGRHQDLRLPRGVGREQRNWFLVFGLLCRHTRQDCIQVASLTLACIKALSKTLSNIDSNMYKLCCYF